MSTFALLTDVLRKPQYIRSNFAFFAYLSSNPIMSIPSRLSKLECSELDEWFKLLVQSKDVDCNKSSDGAIKTTTYTIYDNAMDEIMIAAETAEKITQLREREQCFVDLFG